MCDVYDNFEVYWVITTFEGITLEGKYVWVMPFLKKSMINQLLPSVIRLCGQRVQRRSAGELFTATFLSVWFHSRQLNFIVNPARKEQLR